jgi:hypothetical protein
MSGGYVNVGVHHEPISDLRLRHHWPHSFDGACFCHTGRTRPDCWDWFTRARSDRRRVLDRAQALCPQEIATSASRWHRTLSVAQQRETASAYDGRRVRREANIMSAYRIFGFATVGLTALMDPAFAGVPATPGPIAGIGLPALALIGGAYWIGRKLFAHKK